MGIAALNRLLGIGPESVKAKKLPRNPFAVKLRLEPLEDRRLLSMGDLLQSLVDPSLYPQADSQFGSAVASDGNLTVVSSPYADLQGYRDVGCVYVFNTTTSSLVATLVNPMPEDDDHFGYSVAISGNTVVVGAYFKGTIPYTVNSGSAYLFDAVSGNLLQTLVNPTPESNQCFGYSVAISGNIVVVGECSDNIYNPDPCSAYIFDAATGNLLDTLVNPTPAANDQFGYSVAISGNIVVVGANCDDTGTTAAGSAYIFDATTGNLLHTLANPTPERNDWFGYSVAVSGNTVVVGACRDDTGATDMGSAYIFDALTGNLLHTLTNPTPGGTYEFFGCSVFVFGNTAVVGAYCDITGSNYTGAAYIFDTATGNQLQTLANPTPANDDCFGCSVAISGNNVVVGAPYDDTGAGNSGSAYLIDAATGNLLHTLANPILASSDCFGCSVAISGNNVVVGAVGDDTGATNAGSAYIFDAATGNLLHTLTNPTPAGWDKFGCSVAVSGNIVVVGAVLDFVGSSYAGSAYIFDTYTGNLLYTLSNPVPESHDEFGCSVAVSGNTVVVGALGDENFSGSAYIFDTSTGNLLYTLTNPTPESSDEFGCSVAVSGNTVVVGAFCDGTGANDAGSAYIFDATTGNLLHTLANPTPTSGDSFGYSVAIFDDTVIVGTPYDYIGTERSGSAFIFDATTGNLLRTLVNPAPAYADLFGNSVAISCNTVAVGARLDDTGATDSGAGYIFHATSGNLMRTLANPTPAEDDHFGNSVAISNGVAVVGTLCEDGITYDRGAAYVFAAREPQTFTWDGGSTGDDHWSTGENWSGDLAPLPGDNLVFPAGSLQTESVNDYPAGTVFGEIDVKGGNYSFQNNGLNSEKVQVQYDASLTVPSITAGYLIIGGGETRNWDGGGEDNKWTMAGNWVNDEAPLPGDNLVFPAGALQPESVNDYPAGTLFGSITVSGTGYNFTMGNTSSASVQVVDGGELTADSITTGTLTIGSAGKSAAPTPSVSDAPRTAAEALGKSAVRSAIGGAAGLTAKLDSPMELPQKGTNPVFQRKNGDSPLGSQQILICAYPDYLLHVGQTLAEPVAHNFRFAQALAPAAVGVSTSQTAIVGDQPAIPPSGDLPRKSPASTVFLPMCLAPHVNSSWKTTLAVPDASSTRIAPLDGDWLRDVLQARSRNRDAEENRTPSSAVDALFASGLAGI